MEEWISLGYLLSAALFIFGLKKLGHPRTAPFGNQLGALGMLVAVVTTILQMGLGDGIEWVLIGSGLVLGSLIGLWMAIRVEMTGMPELVALFNGFGGAASALVALSEIWRFIAGTFVINSKPRKIASTKSVMFPIKNSGVILVHLRVVFVLDAVPHFCR